MNDHYSASEDNPDQRDSDIPLTDVQTAIDTIRRILNNSERLLTQDEQGVLGTGHDRLVHLKGHKPELFEDMDATAEKPPAQQQDPMMVTYGVLEHLRDERSEIDTDLMNTIHCLVQDAEASGYQPFSSQ